MRSRHGGAAQHLYFLVVLGFILLTTYTLKEIASMRVLPFRHAPEEECEHPCKPKTLFDDWIPAEKSPNTTQK
jgi:hypothetical protein